MPLDLAWAMSVHKSQGMTLDRCGARASKADGCTATEEDVHPCVRVRLSCWAGTSCLPACAPAALGCRVEVSLERAFEPGMAYVALSRVKALEGLRIMGSIAPQALRAGEQGGGQILGQPGGGKGALAGGAAASCGPADWVAVADDVQSCGHMPLLAYLPVLMLPPGCLAARLQTRRWWPSTPSCGSASWRRWASTPRSSKPSNEPG